MHSSRLLLAMAVIAGLACLVPPAAKAEVILTGEFTDTFDPRNLRIGPNTSGTLTVNEGSVLELRAGSSTTFGGDLLFARQPGSFGFGLIDGAGSAINMIGSEDPTQSQLEGTALQIGRGGTGSLTIRNGASFSMTDPFAAPGTALLKGETAHVGRESTGSGTLHLDNGSFTIDSVGTNLQVGRDSGDGTVILENGSTMLLSDRGAAGDSGATATIGFSGSGDGSLTVDNSTLTIHSDNNEARLHIGRDDPTTTGSVTVTGSTAAVNVTGPDSAIRVGGFGQGVMTVADGASVSIGGDNAVLTVAQEPGSTGSLLVSGGGTVDVGEGGGYLTVGGAYIDFGLPEGGTGSVTITGAGSRVSVVNDVEIGAPLTYGGGNSSGSVDVRNGGRLEAENVLVGLGGTLSGNGTVAANVHLDGGTILPGNSPGTIFVDGDFNMTAGEIYIEVAGIGLGEYDVIDVTGSATLAGGTFIFQFIDGYAPMESDTFEFLTAMGPITIEPDIEFLIAGLSPGLLFDIGVAGGSLLFTSLNDGVLIDVPEPSSLPIFLLGLLALAFSNSRARRIFRFGRALVAGRALPQSL